jgi:hypothetical protein
MQIKLKIGYNINVLQNLHNRLVRSVYPAIGQLSHNVDVMSRESLQAVSAYHHISPSNINLTADKSQMVLIINL